MIYLKKIIALLAVSILCLFIISCTDVGSKKTSSIKNKDNNPISLEYHPETLQSNSNKKIIAEDLFIKYLDHYKDVAMTEFFRITDYKIDEIKIEKEQSDSFVFYVIYSIQTKKK